jgi:hypothetical protein
LKLSLTILNVPNVRGITSIITLIEVCIQPQRQGRLDLVKTYEQALLNARQVQTISINPALAKRAIQITGPLSVAGAGCFTDCRCT